MKIEKLNSARVLSEKEMAEFRGGAQPCKDGCKESCKVACSPGCRSGNKDGIIVVEEGITL